MDDEIERQLQAIAERHGFSDAARTELRAWLGDLLAVTRDPADRETVLGATRLAGTSAETQLPAHTDRFEFRATLGQGAQGEVFRVWDRGLRRSMAMKTLRSDRADATAVLARFVAEAQLTSQLRHPAIVPVHELGRLPDGRLYYTMREVRGTTLATLIRGVHEASGDTWQASAQGTTLRDLVAAFAGACEAVGHAHSRGVIHRDLKPGNLMVGEFGEVQVIDWGIAKRIGTAEDPVQTARDDVEDETRLGEVVGTPAYMAPEQAYGWNDRVDARSDVYALGAILFEILTGRPPYEPRPGQPVLSQVLEGPPGDPGRADGPVPPAALVDLVRVCMARERTARPADAGAVREAVLPWLAGQSIP
ncbi:MAG: serine/threonine protein kinase [Alphaproteobacteria bacterium]|nr:serine/threonine protein kinase [Alphaproteobacteria bacterium]